MKLLKILMIILLSIGIIGCSQINSEKANSSQSWAFKGTIKWNNTLYAAGGQSVEKIGKQIGTIEHFSQEESEETPDNFSNEFPVGTRLFKIPGIDTKDVIAVETRKGHYVKAENEETILNKSNQP